MLFTIYEIGSLSRKPGIFWNIAIVCSNEAREAQENVGYEAREVRKHVDHVL